MGNTTVGSRGLNLIRRYIHGEDLTSQQKEAMRAAMYLLAQYVSPAREWDDFQWQGVEHFVDEIWPKVQDREDVRHGFFGDGLKAP